MGVIAHDLDEAPRSIPDMHVFHENGAGMPSLEQADIYARALIEAGQLDKRPTESDLTAVYRADLYQKAALAVGQASPPSAAASFLSNGRDGQTHAAAKESDAI